MDVIGAASYGSLVVVRLGEVGKEKRGSETPAVLGIEVVGPLPFVILPCVCAIINGWDMILWWSVPSMQRDPGIEEGLHCLEVCATD